MLMMYYAKEKHEKVIRRTLGNWAKYSAIVVFVGVVALGLGFTTTTNSYAQSVEPDGSLDSTFQNSYNNTNGFYPYISSLALQKDGKILSAKSDTRLTGFCSGVECEYFYYGISDVVRLNSNGSHDNSFPDMHFDNGKYVKDMVVQNDGKIIIAGGYNYIFNTYPIPGGFIQRYNGDGSLDNTFNNTTSSFEINEAVHKIALQTDGKILVAGGFDKFNGVSCPSLVRLNPNGSLDPSFKCNNSKLRDINSLLLQSDGKILIAGSFANSSYQNPSISINRLNTDGSLDTSFNTQLDVGYPYHSIVINSITLQNDGKILVTGMMNETGYYLVRLKSDGTLDKTFNPLPFNHDVTNRPDFSMVQSDGKILLAGYYLFYSNQQHRELVRLNADGSLDTSFNPFVPNCCIHAGLLQNDNKILIGGGFSTSGGQYIVRLNNSPKFDSSVTSLTSSSNFATYGQSITLNAIVSSPVTGVAAPSGTVTFTFLGLGSIPVTLFSGVATYVTTTLSTGSYTITAAYSGDANYKSSNSATALSLEVEKVASSTHLNSSANPALVGNTITFTAIPQPIPNASDGTVNFNFNFTDGSSFSTEAVAVINGIASYMTQTQTTDSYTITAVYSGDANRLPSKSPTYTQYVVSGCDPLVVTNNNDNGQATTCGTLSYALAQTIDGKISFNLPAGVNTLSFSDVLTPTLKPGVAIDGGTNVVILDGQGRNGNGLRLRGNNTLINLIIRGFGGRELLIDGKTNRLYRVKVES